MRNPKEHLEDELQAIAAVERHACVERVDFECGELLQLWFLHHCEG